MRKRVFIGFEGEAVAEREAELARLRRNLDVKGPVPHRWARVLSRELEAEAAAHAARALGFRATLREAHVLLADERSRRHLEDDERGVIAGYREARRLAAHWVEHGADAWNSDVLVALHARVLGGNWLAGAGELATTPRRIANRATGADVYQAPSPGEIGVFLEQMWQRLATWRGGAPSQAAWAHIAVMAILPFLQGNSSVAELVSRLCLWQGGFRRPEFGSLEAWWGERPAEYFETLSCLGSEFDSAVDVTPFICTHIDEQIARAEALDAQERAHRQVWTAIENLVAAAQLEPRLAEAVWHVFLGRDVTAGHYIRLAGTSAATATNDLRAAVAAGLLRGEGERRGRRYRAGPELHSEIANSLALSEESAGEDAEDVMQALQARLPETQPPARAAAGRTPGP